MKKGFTYIELLLYIALVTIMLSALIPFAWAVIGSGEKNKTQQELYSQARFITERINYEIRNALDINSVSANQISLKETGATDPTIISLSLSKVFIQQGAGGQTQLNSNDTTVSDLTFSNYTSFDRKTKNIGFTFTIQTPSGLRQEFTESVSLRGSSEIRSN